MLLPYRFGLYGPTVSSEEPTRSNSGRLVEGQVTMYWKLDVLIVGRITQLLANTQLYAVNRGMWKNLGTVLLLMLR